MRIALRTMILLLWASTVSATPILSTLGSTTDGGGGYWLGWMDSTLDGFTTHRQAQVAQAFTLDRVYDDVTLSVMLSGNGGVVASTGAPLTMTLQLATDANGSIGTVFSTFTIPILSTDRAVYTIALPALADASTYWLLGSSPWTQSVVDHVATGAIPIWWVGTGAGTALVEQNGQWSQTPNPLALELSGTAIGDPVPNGDGAVLTAGSLSLGRDTTTPPTHFETGPLGVPEPATLVLMLLVVAIHLTAPHTRRYRGRHAGPARPTVHR